ncbi:MAG: hypothetical protein ACFFD2_01065 [Promethearchaeota archaeon]
MIDVDESNVSFLKILKAVVMLDWNIVMIRDGSGLKGIIIGIPPYIELMIELFPNIFQHVELPKKDQIIINNLPDMDKTGNANDVSEEILLLVNAAKDLGWDIALPNPDKEDNIHGIIIGQDDIVNKILDSLPKDFISQLESKLNHVNK